MFIFGIIDHIILLSLLVRVMGVPNWVCLECKREFNPIKDNGDFTFNCPKCGSPKTVANRHPSVSVESDSGNNQSRK